MPQKILCADCGLVFYEGAELKPPEEVIARDNGLCPQCGRKLAFNPGNVRLSLIQSIEAAAT